MFRVGLVKDVIVAFRSHWYDVDVWTRTISIIFYFPRTFQLFRNEGAATLLPFIDSSSWFALAETKRLHLACPPSFLLLQYQFISIVIRNFTESNK
jgi:hypothetical protein